VQATAKNHTQALKNYSYLKQENIEYIEELYQKYLSDSNSVDESWQYFFEGVDLAFAKENPEQNIKSNGNKPELVAVPSPTQSPLKPTADVHALLIHQEAKVVELIQAYRTFGHLLSDINPLEAPPKTITQLELSSFELTDNDLDRKYTVATQVGLPKGSTLREILSKLKQIYCGTIGVEFSHIGNSQVRLWVQNQLENQNFRAKLKPEQKIHIYEKLIQAEAFERFLHTRYVAQKRFSIEGGDTLIPMLDALICDVAENSASDLVIGMAHRGRLNVLTNILNKKYEHVFSEFDGHLDVSAGEGDVKYHLGYSYDFQTPQGKKIHLSLGFNPSHLEFVNPVVEGMVRAKQFLKLDREFNKVIPVLIHGDAAFCGQGVVYETIQLSLLDGYKTGGTIHIIANNQVGFTTNPNDSRSTYYASDLAKAFDLPIFHVNGDDPEAAVLATKLALQFRSTFHRDIVIDLVCYRKYGHNEGDEPSFTQPLMYKKIKTHPTPHELYAKKLITEGVFSKEQSTLMLGSINDKLTASYNVAKANAKASEISAFEGNWKGLRKASEEEFLIPVITTVDEKILREIGKKLSQPPTLFTPHPKLVRLLEQRLAQIEKGEGMDWGLGEALAYGTIVWEGNPVRLSGQDCERGTFSHRHSVLYDYNTGKPFTPFNNLREGQAKFSVYNSSLSEAGVLGFEYGYSLADPHTLVVWEAQFGDFANGAQVIIDQFLASSESKWKRMSGIVLLLPHGYEGQGPEHSSARLERFLQLCARHNMQVCNLTTPAQIFHALRRQVKREFRKPLVVMSPKSLLRHPEVVSKISEFTDRSFQEILDDPLSPQNPRKILFCSGKIYYDLVTYRATQKIQDIAIVRIEQLYPWPLPYLQKILKKYSSAKYIDWVQEEPKNMGAWNFVHERLSSLLQPSQALHYRGREEFAAPAVGSSKIHEKQQKNLVEEAFSNV